MVRLLKRAWRNDLAAVATSARRSILIVAPFIKYDEAVRFCKQPRSGMNILALANIDSECATSPRRSLPHPSSCLPALCDDREDLIIRGERYGRAWKRRMRHAQLHLRRRGIIVSNTSAKTWMLSSKT